MKKITLLILSCVLLATACNQSSTNPNNPVVPACTSINTAYVEISFNGKTLKSNAYEYLGLKLGSTATISTGNLQSSIQISSIYSCPAGNLLGNLQIIFSMFKTGAPTVGTYNNNGQSYGVVIDYSSGTNKSYTIKDSSITANVSSITSDYITGTFTCTVKDATTDYPATGSFNVLRSN